MQNARRTATCGRRFFVCCLFIWQHRTILALRLKHRSGELRHGICVAKMLDNVGLRYPHRTSGQKPLVLCDRCPCFGSLFPPLAALTFAASSIICAFGLASAAPRSPYRHLELCGIAFIIRAYYLPLKWRRFLLYTWLRYRCPAHTHSRQSLHYQRFRSKSRNTGQ